MTSQVILGGITPISNISNVFCQHTPVVLHFKGRHETLSCSQRRHHCNGLSCGLLPLCQLYNMIHSWDPCCFQVHSWNVASCCPISCGDSQTGLLLPPWKGKENIGMAASFSCSWIAQWPMKLTGRLIAIATYPSIVLLHRTDLLRRVWRNGWKHYLYWDLTSAIHWQIFILGSPQCRRVVHATKRAAVEWPKKINIATGRCTDTRTPVNFVGFMA